MTINQAQFAGKTLRLGTLVKIAKDAGIKVSVKEQGTAPESVQTGCKMTVGQLIAMARSGGAKISLKPGTRETEPSAVAAPAASPRTYCSEQLVNKLVTVKPDAESGFLVQSSDGGGFLRLTGDLKLAQCTTVNSENGPNITGKVVPLSTASHQVRAHREGCRIMAEAGEWFRYPSGNDGDDAAHNGYKLLLINTGTDEIEVHKADNDGLTTVR